MGKGIVQLGIAFLTISLLTSAPRHKPLETPISSMALSDLLERGSSLSAQGNYEDARRIFAQAREVAKKSGLHREEARCLFKLGLLAWNQGQIAEAANHFSAGFALAEGHSDVDLETLLAKSLRVVELYNIGKTKRSNHQLGDSVRSFDEAILLAHEIHIADFEPKCLRQKSLTLWQLEDLIAYLHSSERAAALAHDLRNAAEEGKCLNNIGVYYEKTCDYSKGMSYFEEALQVAQTGRDLATAAECLTNLGVIYLRLNDFAQAEAFFARAAGIDEGLQSSKSLAMDYNNLGVAVLKRISPAGKADGKTLDRARSYFDRCRVLLMGDDDPYTRLLAEHNVGYIDFLRKEYAKATWRYTRCMSLAKDLQSSYMLSTLSINQASVCLEQGQVREAMDNLKRAIDYGTRAGAGDLLWEAFSGLGECCEEDGEKLLALRYYESAIAAIERTKSLIVSDPFRVGFIRNKSEVFRRAVDLLAAQYKETPSTALLDRIFLFMEKAKSQALLDSLTDAGPVLSQAMTPSMKKREEESSRKISSLFIRLSDARLTPAARENLKAELDEEEAEYQRILTEVRLANRGTAELIAPSLCDLRDVQTHLLDPRTALLEYFLGERRSYRITITDRRAEFQELPDQGMIEGSLRGYLKVLSSPPSSSPLSSAAASRIAKDLLVTTGSLALQGVESLLIVPDGVLYYLPFESLITSGSLEGPSHFLAEDYGVSYSPSASVLMFLNRPSDRVLPAKRFLAVADPGPTPPFPTEPFRRRGSPSSLPFSRSEAVDIARIFDPRRSDVLVGKDASETAIKTLALEQYAVVHFACHGLIDIAHPHRSALLLSKGAQGNDDGYLQAREIYNLRMRADLVVLSACETATGPLESPEGMMGLPRAFFCAGARSVLSSLWPVHDKATAALMKDFYRAAANGIDISQALRAAKRHLIHSPFGHPYYWAGFVLAGYPGPLSVPLAVPR